MAWHRDNDPSESVRDAAAEAIGTELGRYLRSGDRYLEDDCDDE